MSVCLLDLLSDADQKIIYDYKQELETAELQQIRSLLDKTPVAVRKIVKTYETKMRTYQLKEILHTSINQDLDHYFITPFKTCISYRNTTILYTFYLGGSRQRHDIALRNDLWETSFCFGWHMNNKDDNTPYLAYMVEYWEYDLERDGFPHLFR